MSDKTISEAEQLKASPEQMRYASLLYYGAWIGLFLLLITYLVYVLGFLTPHAEIQMVVNNWDKGLHDYMQITNKPGGWGWTSLVGYGDFLNYIGLAILAAITIPCYFTLLPGYLKRKNMKLFYICVAEIVVLTLAASGILGSGGH